MISAVMPSYNQGNFIGEALDSILNQGYPHLEVIVVDGQSKDNTLDVLKGYGDRIQWSSEKDKNQSDALNKGFAKAKGEIIAWLNSDDAYDTDALRTVGQYFAEHPECEWLFGRCIIIDENSREIRKWITAYKNFFLRRYSYGSLLAQNCLSQMAVFFRRRLMDEVGPVDVQYQNGMDYDLFLRFAAKHEPHFIDQNLGKFRVHTYSKTVYQTKDLFDSDFAIAKKHAGSNRWAVLLHKLFHIGILTFYGLAGFWASLKAKIKK